MRPFREYNLAPCTREPWPALRPLLDLAGSLSMAQEVVGKVQRHLELSEDWPTFNGLARPADARDGESPAFYVQMWDERGLYRSLAFRDLGYVGVLNIEPKPGCKASRFFADYVGAAFHGVDQHCLHLGGDAASFCLVAWASRPWFAGASRT